MFYDMGSGSTVATIVTYQTVKTKEAGTQPQLQIRGVGLVLHIVQILCGKGMLLCVLWDAGVPVIVTYGVL